MLISQNRKQLVLNSALELGEDLTVEKKGKGRKFVSRFIEAGVAHYQEFGDILITKETLDKFIHTMVGCPLIINHKEITDKNADKERVGVISNVWFNDMDGWYYCDGIIWDLQAIDLVKNQGWSVSCTYDFVSDNLEKTHNGKKISMEFIDGEFLHLALVNNPRYERANIVINSKDQVENEKWITIKPHGDDSDDYRRLKLEDGETPKEAIDRVYKKEDKKLSNKEAHEKLNSLRDKMRKYEVAGTRTSDEYKQLKEEYQKTLDEWDISQPNEERKSPLHETFGKEFFDKYNPEGKELPKDFVERYSNKEEKESKKETSDSPFGEGVEITEHDKKGYMLDSKNLKTYRKGEKYAIVDDWSHDDKDRYTVSFHNGKKEIERNNYTTKRGMEKAIREHLQSGENKETKALSEKTNLEEKQNTYKDILKKYNEADKKRWARGITNKEYHQAWDDYEKYKKELTKARREYAESIMSNFEEQDNSAYIDKQNARRERFAELADKNAKLSEGAHQKSRDMMSVIPMGQPIHGTKDRNYREKAWDKLGQAVQLDKKSKYYEEKAKSVGRAGISADDANAIAKLAQKYKSGVDSAEKRRIIDRVISIHSARTSSKPASETSEHGFSIERNQDKNRLQLKFDGKPDENTRKVLKSNGFRWAPSEGAWQRQLTGNAEYSLKRVQEQLKQVQNNVNEIVKGNVFMSVFEELENFVKNIVNNACDKDEEMDTVENEDKRKIIDEVGGILKDKVDEEVWRTVIGKLEKIAYNPSEDDKADNKCKNEDDEEEEKEEKFEEEKEIAENKKAKNEEKEDKEEDKKDEKADNKCAKNSMDDVKRAIMGGNVKAKEASSYVSQADRLKAGEQY